MDGVAVKPLTVGFHETPFLSKLNQENKLGFWFQLDDQARQQAGSPWGPANPQALNRYSYVLNNPLKYTDPSGHHPIAAVLAFFGIASAGPIIAVLAVTFTVVTLATFLSDAGNRAWLGERISAGVLSAQSLSDYVFTMGRKKEDIRWINYLQKKYRLTDKQREELHDYITKRGMSKEEIEQEAKDMSEENKK
jgi:hypothetical protein